MGTSIIIVSLSAAVIVLLVCLTCLLFVNSKRDVENRFDEVYNRINEVVKDTDAAIVSNNVQILNISDELWREISSLRDEIDRRLEEISRTNKSYTDSRFDSSVNKTK